MIGSIDVLVAVWVRDIETRLQAAPKPTAVLVAQLLMFADSRDGYIQDGL